MALPTKVDEALIQQMMAHSALRPIFDKVRELVPDLTVEERMAMVADVFKSVGQRLDTERQEREKRQALNLLCGALRGVAAVKEVEDQYPQWGSW